MDITDKIKEATYNALKVNVKKEDIESLLKELPPIELIDNSIEISENFKPKNDVPTPIWATGGIEAYFIYSKVTCRPNEAYREWHFDEDAWGLGIGGGSSKGFMYTAYNSWEGFFKNVTAYHCQGISGVGGIFQINWFNSEGVPVGQFNGVSIGAGAFEFGGPGHWKK